MPICFNPILAILIGEARRIPSMKSLPSISVLVPAHNEVEVIRDKIANFQGLDYPQDLIELVIADDGSSDDTAQVVSAQVGGQVRLIRNPKRLARQGQ